MLIEIHMLKNYPATILNRDDANMPKTLCFGGVERARISSQYLKHSWRKSALFGMKMNELGQKIRLQTRKFPSAVCKKLEERGIGNDFLKVVPDLVKAIATGGGKKDKNKEGVETEDADVAEEKEVITKQVMLYSEADILAFVDAFADAIKECSKPSELKKKKDEIKAKLKELGIRPVSPDIALFGRMVTNDIFHGVDGAMYVAHAFSTHKVVQESDFFVATDDLVMGDEFGGGMMDDADFNSSCYYINGTIDVDMLCKNMKEVPEYKNIVKQMISTLIETMAFVSPSGKQHSFAGSVLPYFVVIEIKDAPKPLTYANAFVKPIGVGVDDLVTASVKRLEKFIEKLNHDYDLGVTKRLWFCSGLEENVVYSGADEVTTNCESFKEILKGVNTALETL